MIIKLDSGKKLTLEEVKEVIDKFQDLLGDKKEEVFIPYIQPHQPNYNELEYIPYRITCTDGPEQWYEMTHTTCEEIW